jgi:hypothetical protein
VSKPLIIELPDQTLAALEAFASRTGRSASEVASELLVRYAPTAPSIPDPEARRRLMRHAGTIDTGDPDSAHNERIDADLAREYLDDHSGK